MDPGLFWDPLFEREQDEPSEDPEHDDPDDSWLESERESSISLLFSKFSPLGSVCAVWDWEPFCY